MARGTVVGESVVSQASTDEYRENHEKALGERPQGVRGRWVWDETRKELVRAEDYRPPPAKCGTGIMADRVHEGTFYDDGDRKIPIDSRAKRRAFMRERGVAESSDYSPQYREQAARRQERSVERRIDSCAEEAARKLYHQGKMRD